MTEALFHRGPDAGGTIRIDKFAVFGHRRLAIIDLSEQANQPLQDISKRFTIIYNGEIYNYLELKSVLQEKGCSFRTNSDTEVALFAFMHWGSACFNKFNGMFALAIWDSHEKELVLARDRFGEKPLYYSLLNNEISFSSDLHSILEDEKINSQASISIPGLNHFLAMGYILSPLTIYEGINKLESAHFIRFRNGKIVEKRSYWNYSDCFRAKGSAKKNEIISELDHILEKAVDYRLISDVPVGAFLSGGLDSSGIVAYAKKRLNYDLHTFSVGFPETSYNEADDAKIVAEFLKTTHHQLVPDLSSDLGCLNRAIGCYTEPFSDTSLIPMVLVSEFASKKVKVVLSGDGADEIFGGYATYRADHIHRQLSKFPPVLRQFLSRLLKEIKPRSNRKTPLSFKLNQFSKGISENSQYAHYSWRELFSEKERISIIGKQYEELVKGSCPSKIFKKYYAQVEDLHPLNQHLYVDAKTWLTDDILVKIDRATMAFGLEARAPYLDPELVEYAATIPPQLKFNGYEGKIILKEVLKKHLPSSTIKKKKTGFNAPINSWLAQSADNEFRVFNNYVLREKRLLDAIKTERMA
jgi:asparagine synthase (glutamine-hydrolysing)